MRPTTALGSVRTWEKASEEGEVPAGASMDVEMPNGGTIKIRKLERDFGPRDKVAALKLLRECHVKKEFLTGLLYVNPQAENFLDLLDLGPAALATLPQAKVRPSKAVLDQINDELR